MKSGQSKSGNVTHEKLSGLPFNKASELKEAEKQIQQEVWSRLTRAKYFQELTQREEYSFFQKIFQQGIVCQFDKDVDIVNMALDKEQGCFILSIPDRLRSREEAGLLQTIEVMVKGFSEGFMTNYLTVMGLLPDGKSSKSIEP